MSEAMTALLDFAFDGLGLHRVEALVDEPNVRSAALLRRLGFVLEGTLRERFFFGGVFYTELLFGLLSRGWKEGRRQLPGPASARQPNAGERRNPADSGSPRTSQ
jgi:RimJ/RimL family protein N-acetyltransferase